MLNFLVVIGVLGVGYLFFTRVTMFSTGGGPTTGVQSLTGVPTQAPGVGQAVAPSGSNLGGLGLAEQAAGTVGAAGGPIGMAAAGAFDSLVNIFASASAARRKAAIAENTMLQQSVPGYDQEIAQVVNSYNQGRLSAAQVLQFFASPQTKKAGLTSTDQGIIWVNFWQEMTPVIQAGRNGCQGGTVPHTVSFCTGDRNYGAACCVGYDNLDNSLLYLTQALAATESDGAPHTAQIVAVYASKYGGLNRPGYGMTLQKPGGVVSVVGGVQSLLGSIGL